MGYLRVKNFMSKKAFGVELYVPWIKRVVPNKTPQQNLIVLLCFVVI
jgi:hypothetical protein